MLTELLEKATRGDRLAQDQLYRQAEPELRKLALHWIRRYSAKEQVLTTEVINRAFLKLMGIDSPGWRHRGDFYQFASRNILCVVIDQLRSLPRQHAPLPNRDDADGPAQAEGLTLHTLLTIRDALEDLGRTLSEEHRAVVEMRFLGECTLNEAADLLSISRDKAFRMSRVALKYLRDKLGPGFPDLAYSPNDTSGG